MSWPATPLATFVDNTTPACDASFLNSLQSGVNGLCLGVYSYKAISVDGTGGVAATPTAGSITASGNIGSTGGSVTGTTGLLTGLAASSTATPSATTVPIGTICKGGIACAAGSMTVFSGASIQRA